MDPLMKILRRCNQGSILLSAAMVAIGSLGFGAASGETVTIHELEGKLRIEIGGKLFTEYLFADTPKPICYPVIGPQGLAMTRNYPMKRGVAGESKDHPHHRSLWFTHGEVNGISFWHESEAAGQIVHEELLKLESGSARATIQSRARWVGPDGKAVCTDTRTMGFEAAAEGRIIDFEITVHASHGKLTFGDTKEGTMGIRTHPNLRLSNNPEHGVTTANGQAINSEGHRDKDLWGKRAKWVDYWAEIKGHVVGVAIFDHPDNPRHPTWWHARDYGLVAANPFGVHNFEKKPKGTGDLVIPAGDSVTFRYRFLFHEGDADQAKIADLYRRYTEQLRSAPAN